MNKNYFKRGIALLLSVAMMFCMVIPVDAVGDAAEPSAPRELGFTEVESLPEVDREGRIPAFEEAAPMYAPDEIVRVSIVLDQPSTIESGFSTIEIAENPQAMAYRANLQAAQAAKEAEIEATALNGASLDVVWNMTLAANIISANVQYGQIEAIKNVAGIKDVFVETQYAPAVTEDNLPVDPNMSTSSTQIGSTVAYAEGYTGIGSKVAVIDTGIDPDHELFQPGPFEASIQEAGAMDKLMTKDDVAELLPKLNIASIEGVTADKLYQTSKNPFAFNYVDENFDISHDNDGEGEHGSHVTGIAAANRLVEKDGKFVSSLETVKTMGVAPDAQIVTMKVFGTGGGAYDSDYMVAIEDAVILGCDSINLSLGSALPGPSKDYVYADILDSLASKGSVVTISAGNAGYWAENSLPTTLYADDVSFDMVGSPGSYTNSLSVASVDNNGFTGNYLKVGDSLVFYTESSGYNNPPFASVAKEYDFVYIDSVGTPGEFAQVDVKGKIALCNRGSTNFSAKANAAADAGAAGVIIVNNAPGTINMDLSDYLGEVPVVSITQADGELFKTNRSDKTIDVDAQSTGSGAVYTGKVTAAEGVESSAPQISEDNDYTMSSFSSWGVPGSLELKPEITAPGGNIYSVNGAIKGGHGYENMSGTSMAAPQVAGMAAVLGQYIRDNDLVAKTGYTQRQLINSLLMSTAMPVVEDDYWYSVLVQGSGLADVGAASQADALVMMDADANAGAADGKVKVELGDDPSKSGVYDYSFTIKNISDTQNDYSLSTDIFTQDTFTANLGNDSYPMINDFLDTSVSPLIANVSYTVNGTKISSEFSTLTADVDKDGDTDEFDAQAVLEYVIGNVDGSAYDLAAADVDKDNDVDSYDAHLILKGLGDRITLAPGETAEIDVHIVVDTAALTSHKNGAYIEGYTFIKPVASEEGVLDVDYSIPILGYYGNWSDPSMFDRVSYYEYVMSSYSKLPYTGDATNDIMEFEDTSAGEEYILAGSAFEEFGGYPDRLAINPEDVLTNYYYTLIRSGVTAAIITDEDGNVVGGTNPIADDAAFYYSTSASWQYTGSSVSINASPAELGFKNNDKMTVSIVSAPEYYTEDITDADGNVKFEDFAALSKKLGKGSSLSQTITVDGEKPKLLSAVLDEEGNLLLTVQDNFYVDGIVIYTDNVMLDQPFMHAQAPEQTAPGQKVTITLPAQYVELFGLANQIYGNGTDNVYISVEDYAYNSGAYVFDTVSHDYGDAKPTGISLPESVSVFENGTNTIKVSVEPALIDGIDVKWTVEDTTVATINNGVVTGLKIGTTTATATAVDYPQLTATTTINVVSAPSYDLSGMIYNADSKPMWSTFNTSDPSKFHEVKQDNPYYAGALNADETTIYTHDGTSVYSVDANTFESQELFAINPAYLFPDAAPNIWFAEMYANEDVIIGVKAGTGDIELMGPASSSVWSFSTTSIFGRIAAISFVGLDQEGNDYYYLVNEAGDMFLALVTYSGSLRYAEIGNIGITLKGASNADGVSYASMEYDWDNRDDENEYLYLSSYTKGDDTAYLYTIRVTADGAEVLGRGEFGPTVWPAVSLFSKTLDESSDTEAVKARYAYSGISASKLINSPEIMVSAVENAALYPMDAPAPEAGFAGDPLITDWSSNGSVEPIPEPIPEPTPEPTPEPIPEPAPVKIEGSLNVLPYDVTKPEFERKAEIDTYNNTLTLTYSLDDLTNEEFHVVYDANTYSFVSAEKLIPHIAYKVGTNGNIAIAAAAAEETTTPVIRFVFKYLDSKESDVINGRKTPISYSAKKGPKEVAPNEPGGKDNPQTAPIPYHYHTILPIILDQNSHLIRCSSCGDVFGIYPHNFVNGVCVECNYHSGATIPVQPDVPENTASPDTIPVTPPTAAGHCDAELEG